MTYKFTLGRYVIQLQEFMKTITLLAYYVTCPAANVILHQGSNYLINSISDRVIGRQDMRKTGL